MATDFDMIFGSSFTLTLSELERKYLALEPINQCWDRKAYYSKTNYYHTRVTAFFEQNDIVKVIYETKKIVNDEIILDDYCEYDTQLATDGQENILPLTSRGKPKALTASNIKSVTPFGCRFYLSFNNGNDSIFSLDKPRANREFPVGDRELTTQIKSESDFHSFMQHYISTCREDYFVKLEELKNSRKVTIKYRPGDIFRMEYDRNRYGYGIIMGEVKSFLQSSQLPEKHSFRYLMTVPLMIRCYQGLSERADLKYEQLKELPLGKLQICSDNNIIWGTHQIVDHKELDENDIEFNFICSKIISYSPHTTLFTQDSFMKDGLISKQEYSLYIEWGFAQTQLNYSQLSEKLKVLLENYSSPHGGVLLSISPEFAKEDECSSYLLKKNLLMPHNKEILNEIFVCLGIDAGTDFDEFAEKFGGLKKKELLKIASSKVKRSKKQ